VCVCVQHVEKDHVTFTRHSHSGAWPEGEGGGEGHYQSACNTNHISCTTTLELEEGGWVGVPPPPVYLLD